MAIRLIVGLGNPGSEYDRTRHNAGFWFFDALVEKSGARVGRDAKLHGDVGKINIAGETVWLLKPNTFMNRSGRAVQAALAYYKIESQECLVAHDDLDLPAGAVRLKFDGGHGGQNGLRDIVAQIGHGKFHRLRLGIGHPGNKDLVTPWVLGRPGRDDEAAIKSAVEKSLNVIEKIVTEDMANAMTVLHTPAEKLKK